MKKGRGKGRGKVMDYNRIFSNHKFIRETVY